MNRIILILIFISLNTANLYSSENTEVNQVVESYTNMVRRASNSLNWEKEKLLKLNNNIINNISEAIDINEEIFAEKYREVLTKFMSTYNVKDKKQQLKISNSIIDRIYREKANKIKYIENANPREIYVEAPDGYYANLNIDKKTAEKLAEIFMEMIYGNDVLSRKPWDIFEEENSYKIIVPLQEKNARGVKIQNENPQIGCKNNKLLRKITICFHKFLRLCETIFTNMLGTSLGTVKNNAYSEIYFRNPPNLRNPFQAPILSLQASPTSKNWVILSFSATTVPTWANGKYKIP